MRFSTTFAALCSASAITAVALPQQMAVVIPVIPVINYNGGGGILQNIGFLALDQEITNLNNSLTNFNAASLQSQAGGVVGGVVNGIKGIFTGLGLSNTASNAANLAAINNVLTTVVGPLLGGLSNSGGVLSSYQTVLNNIAALNAQNTVLQAVQAQLVNDYLVQYQARLQQLLTLIQARQADFAALSGGSLPTTAQATLTNLLGGANAGNSLQRVQAFLSQLNLNNDQLLSGSTSLVSRVAPNLQQALSSLQTAIQNLIRVTIQVYMVPA